MVDQTKLLRKHVERLVQKSKADIQSREILQNVLALDDTSFLAVITNPCSDFYNQISFIELALFVNYFDIYYLSATAREKAETILRTNDQSNPEYIILQKTFLSAFQWLTEQLTHAHRPVANPNIIQMQYEIILNMFQKAGDNTAKITDMWCKDQVLNEILVICLRLLFRKIDHQSRPHLDVLTFYRPSMAVDLFGISNERRTIIKLATTIETIFGLPKVIIVSAIDEIIEEFGGSTDAILMKTFAPEVLDIIDMKDVDLSEMNDMTSCAKILKRVVNAIQNDKGRSLIKRVLEKQKDPQTATAKLCRIFLPYAQELGLDSVEKIVERFKNKWTSDIAPSMMNIVEEHFKLSQTQKGALLNQINHIKAWFDQSNNNKD